MNFQTQHYDKEKLHKIRPLVVLTGPTAVGKTAISIEFAKTVQGEIISADSMQIYRGMDIGSAKIRREEMNGVPHHLLDILEPEETFNVMLFQQLAKKAIEEIYDRGHIPILTGGTGFYIQSVLYDISFTEETDTSVRNRLEQEAEKNGAEYLHRKLAEVDPVTAENIHANNVKRVIRALEFYELNGYPLSQHNETERQKASPYLFRYYVLNEPRDILYERIEKRVDQMLEEGLVEEVEALKKRGCTRDMVSMQGLGYKEILDYLAGICTLEEAVETIKKETRHFAKRQLTWFRREKEVSWIEKSDFADMQTVLDFLIKDFEENIKSSLINHRTDIQIRSDMSNILKTNRLILRPWHETDAEDLYEYAKSPEVGPVAGWPVHTSVENSREIIRTVFSADNVYAVCLKENNRAIGCAAVTIGSESNLNLPETEGEIGYWIGVPFWGRGLIPEAVKELMRYGFEELKLEKLWCGYFEGNDKSRRVQEKCGFRYHHTNKDIHWKLMDDIRTEHVTRMTKEEWLSSSLDRTEPVES